MKQTTKNVIEDYRKQVGELKAQVKSYLGHSPTPQERCNYCIGKKDYELLQAKERIKELEKKLQCATLKTEGQRIIDELKTTKVEDPYKNIRVNDCGTCNHGGDIIGQCYNPKGSSIRECWEKKEVYHAFDGIDIQKMKNTYLSDICDKMAKEQCRFVEKTCSTCRYSGGSFCLCTKGNRPSPLYGCWEA